MLINQRLRRHRDPHEGDCFAPPQVLAMAILLFACIEKFFFLVFAEALVATVGNFIEETELFMAEGWRGATNSAAGK